MAHWVPPTFRSISMTRLLLLLWTIVTWSSLRTVAFAPKCFRPCNNKSPITLAMKAVPSFESDRRRFLLGGLTTSVTFWTKQADARGLIVFPPKEPLGNTYHFMRAGESLLEAEDVWSTNPLFLTNREAALSNRGVNEVEEACRQLKAQTVNPTLVRYSLAASATDTANIVGRELRIGRDRLVPEFNFMDPRSVGRWDTLPLSTTEAAVWAMDTDEAGAQGMGARPPANEDGTPHETLSDQVVRLRQLISGMRNVERNRVSRLLASSLKKPSIVLVLDPKVCETQFSGETVLLVFPDGTGPALLSAMIGGIPLNRAHELELGPAQVRLDVTMDSTLALLASRSQEARDEYSEVLEKGRDELRRLRDMPIDSVVSVKDQQLEKEQIEIEKELQRKAKEKKAQDEATRAAQRQRAMEVKAERKKRRDEIAAARREQLNQRQSNSGNSDAAQQQEQSSPVSVILGSAGAILLGGLAVMNSDSDVETEQGSSVQEAKAVRADLESANVSEDPATPEESSAKNLSKFQQDRAYEDETEQSGEDPSVLVPSAQRINGDKDATVLEDQKDTPDPYPQRRQTIQTQYDDGGDSWLESLSEIMQEEDEEDDDTT